MSKSGFASFAFRLWLAACMVVILGISFLGYVAAEKRIDRASKDKIDLILLAEELKASSDNLTRMARSFVVTMDPAYEDSYREILDIREGRLPGRGPKSHVHWELGQRNPSTEGDAANSAVSLVERMRRTGATEDEFRLLTEAKEESDRLAAVEQRAMEETRKLAPGDAVGQLRIVSALHDANYHASKMRTMESIARFFAQIDARTSQAVNDSVRSAALLRVVVMALGICLLLVLWSIYRNLLRLLGGSVDEVHRQIRLMGGQAKRGRPRRADHPAAFSAGLASRAGNLGS